MGLPPHKKAFYYPPIVLILSEALPSILFASAIKPFAEDIWFCCVICLIILAASVSCLVSVTRVTRAI